MLFFKKTDPLFQDSWRGKEIQKGTKREVLQSFDAVSAPVHKKGRLVTAHSDSVVVSAYEP